MPLSPASRAFLTAALGHLAIAAALLWFNGSTHVLTIQWDAWLWLVVIGFVGCSATGFSLHLFPTAVRGHRPSERVEWVAFGLGEAATIVGAVVLAGSARGTIVPGVFSVAAGLLLGWTGTIVYAFLSILAKRGALPPRPGTHAGDVVTLPGFLFSWASAIAAALLFVLSAFSPGPGLGWWIAAVHLYLLGHAVLLIVVVSLRLAPRSLGVEVPRPATYLVLGLAVSGAVLFPTGLLVTASSASAVLSLFAVPEAGLGLSLLAVLAFLGVRSSLSRPQFGIQVVAVGLLLLGGGVGMWMVSAGDFAAVTGHAVLNVLGFVGLTILAMWFSMIAPFQRVSHAWTRRMFWILSAAWVISVLGYGVSAMVAVPVGSATSFGSGALLLVVVLAWGIGTLPVLYPSLRPLPGLSSERIRAIRDRWSRR